MPARTRSSVYRGRCTAFERYIIDYLCSRRNLSCRASYSSAWSDLQSNSPQLSIPREIQAEGRLGRGLLSRMFNAPRYTNTLVSNNVSLFSLIYSPARSFEVLRSVHHSSRYGRRSARAGKRSTGLVSFITLLLT